MDIEEERIGHFLFQINTAECKKYIIKTSLYYCCITPTCFSPQKPIFKEYDRYISAVRSTKRFTRWNP